MNTDDRLTISEANRYLEAQGLPLVVPDPPRQTICAICAEPTLHGPGLCRTSMREAAALASVTDDERRDLATLRRLLPVIVDDRTAETWLAFGRIEKALGHGIYGDTAPSREKQR